MEYSRKLKQRRRTLREKISQQEQKLDAMKPTDSDFFEEYNKLNLMRIDYQTVVDRINNLNHYPPGMGLFNNEVILTPIQK